MDLKLPQLLNGPIHLDNSAAFIGEEVSHTDCECDGSSSWLLLLLLLGGEQVGAVAWRDRHVGGGHIGN